MESIGQIFRIAAAAVALALVVVTVTLVGSATVDRDVMVRRGRGTSQRLDTIDGLAHAHEISEPDTAPAGRAVEETGAVRPQAPRFDARDAVLIPASAAVGGFDVGALRADPIPANTPSMSDVRSTRGRSPPIA